MNDVQPTPEAPPAAQPTIHRRRHVSPVWAIPVVAALIAVWLAWTTLAQKGPTITIAFRTGDGLEAGKTRIKHNNVELGVVDRLELSPDLSEVIATAQMSRAAARHLTQGTRFWVVRPRLSVTGFSGLETLVSGAYIEMEPGEGAYAQTFQGLEEPPVVRADVPGRSFILRTERLGSLGPGSPIYFRGIKVGEVLGYDFTGGERQIDVHAFVRTPFDRLVHDASRFWNASGVTLGAGAQGFKVEIESLQALLAGGVAFETPEAAQGEAPAAEGAVFPLFADHDSVQNASFTLRSPYVVEFSGSVHGLEVGAPVEFRGVRVGSVTDIHMEYDPKRNVVQVPVTLELERQRVREADATMPPGSNLTAVLIEHGMRAQLRSSSLLTGQLLVALELFPNAPAATLDTSGPVPRIPTVPSDLETITSSLSGLLERLASLPLEDLVKTTQHTIEAYEGLAQAPELKEALRSLSKTMAAAEALAREADVQAGPLLTSLRRAAGSADGAFARADATLSSITHGYGNDSQVRRQIADLTQQLQDTARSVKHLADYLELHPESLLRGKLGSSQ